MVGIRFRGLDIGTPFVDVVRMKRPFADSRELGRHMALS